MNNENSYKLLQSHDSTNITKGIELMMQEVYERIERNIQDGGDGKGNRVANEGANYLRNYIPYTEKGDANLDEMLSSLVMDKNDV